MSSLFEGFVYGIRFLLEVVTVFALIGGGMIKGESFEKILFPVLGLLIVGLWGLFVAPKAAFPQEPLVKLVTELFSFTAGAVGIYYLFGNPWGVVYAVTAIVDLALVYFLVYIG